MRNVNIGKNLEVDIEVITAAEPNVAVIEENSMEELDEGFDGDRMEGMEEDVLEEDILEEENSGEEVSEEFLGEEVSEEFLGDDSYEMDVDAEYINNMDPAFEEGMMIDPGFGMEMPEVKDPILSSWLFVIGLSVAVLLVGSGLGALLARIKIKKGIDLYED